MKHTLMVISLITGVCLVYGIYYWQARVSVDALTQQFQARAFATADNPKLARQVIVESIYARRTLAVALAYHKAMQEKPWRTARIANFAHAAAIVNSYGSDEEITNAYAHAPGIVGPNTSDEIWKWGQQAAKSLIKPPDDMDVHTEIQREDQKNFRPTQIADAWLAWATFCGDDQEMSLCFQNAQKLDPNFGEAYYQPESLGFIPDGKGGYKNSFKFPKSLQNPAKYRAYDEQQRSKAEQLEPSLQPLVTEQRYAIALCSGDKAAAANYLQECLRAWPTAFQAQHLREEMANKNLRDLKLHQNKS